MTGFLPVEGDFTMPALYSSNFLFWVFLVTIIALIVGLAMVMIRDWKQSKAFPPTPNTKKITPAPNNQNFREERERRIVEGTEREERLIKYHQNEKGNIPHFGGRKRF